MDPGKNPKSYGNEEVGRIVSAIEELEKSVSSLRSWLKPVFAGLLPVWLTVLLAPLLLPYLIAPFL